MLAASAFSPEKLRELRRGRGLTRESLAVLSGRSMTSIFRFETGRTAPSLAVALVLAEALDCEVEDLLEEVP